MHIIQWVSKHLKVNTELTYKHGMILDYIIASFPGPLHCIHSGGWDARWITIPMQELVSIASRFWYNFISRSLLYLSDSSLVNFMSLRSMWLHQLWSILIYQCGYIFIYVCYSLLVSYRRHMHTVFHVYIHGIPSHIISYSLHVSLHVYLTHHAAFSYKNVGETPTHRKWPKTSCITHTYNMQQLWFQ